MKINGLPKKVLSFLLICCMVLSYLPTTAFAATEEAGFTYGVYDESAGNIKITGYIGTLKSGQNLVVPSEIDGKTVVAIEGTYGTVGAGLGTFTLPDTLQTIKNLHVYGFTGTLVIPASVTSIAQPDGLYFSDIEELVVNATMEMYFSNKYLHYNNHENPLKKIVIGDGIKYFIASMYFDAEYYPNLETVKVSDNVQYIGAKNSNATFYLKKFEAPIIRQLNNNTPPSYGPTGETTEARGLALGLEGCKYYYTNEGEELPVEQLFITSTTGFTPFWEDDPSSMWGQTSYPGLYAGWSSTIQVNTTPINASNTEDILWSSSNETVATVENGVITAKDIGKTTISATLNGLTVEHTIVIRNIYIVSTDGGVNADNLPGNMEISDVNLNTQAGISLELEVDKLNPKDWTQWGQLKKALEEALNKSLECSDAFDIQVKLKNGTYTWKVQPIEGKRISIWMPIENAQDISKRHLVHLKDDGTYEELDFEYEPIDGDHGIRFETTSFSSFILLEDACSNGHAWNDDCDADCNRCGATRTPAAHKGGTATCKEKAKCSVCGVSYGSLAGHKFGSYVYNNDATSQKDGTQTRTCSICQKTETVTATGTKLKNPFKDVKLDQYYAEPVLWAVGKKITNGMTADSFAPNNECTRGQIVTFLWRAAGSPEPTSTNNPFVDVTSDQYYYKAVLWAVEKGITTGTSANTFSPNAGCTRGQVVTFLHRAKGKPAASGSNAFADVKAGAYYYDAVRWAVANNITNGMSATSFAPDATCTRGQIVTFLYRAYK